MPNQTMASTPDDLLQALKNNGMALSFAPSHRKEHIRWWLMPKLRLRVNAVSPRQYNGSLRARAATGNMSNVARIYNNRVK